MEPVAMTEQPLEPLEIEYTFPANTVEILSHNLANTDPKIIHDKFAKYESLDTEERLSIVKNLPLMLEQICYEGLLVLKPILNIIVKDRDNIAKVLLERLGEVCKYLERHNNLEESLKTTIIPLLITYLNFNQLDIKEQAGKYLGLLAHRLNDKDRGDFVLRHVIEMAHDDSNEENRIVAVQLFSSMSECFGKQLCEQFIGLEILSLGEDVSFKVRKEAIRHLPIISKLVSLQFFNRLFNFYVTKSKDATGWAIRKACVDIIIDIAELSSFEEREGALTYVLLAMLRDTNKWVRISAYKALGHFLHLLKGLKINARLVGEYLKMADNDINSLGKDNEIVYSCAYNLPAVLDALGAAHWESELWKLYEKLLKCTDKRVKQTMSYSLHEVARLLGELLTYKYLFKVVDTFFKDKNDEIKLGMIRHISEIMRVLSEPKREALIGVFEYFQKDQKKWRIRECIGRQLGQILYIYQPQTIFEYVVPILLKFCSDSVSIVRVYAASKVGDFIQKLTGKQGLHLGLIESVKAFGTSPKYTQRQAFLIMCVKLMNQKELFQTHFLYIFLGMADDKVVNVKLVLAEIVQKHIVEKECLSEDPALLKLKEKLAQDADVRETFFYD